MVKKLLAFCLLFTFSYATNFSLAQEVVSKDDELVEKIKSFLDEKTFSENRKFIDIIFEPKSAFYRKERLDTLKVVQTLKENGLLRLFFDSPREFHLNFKTSGSPLFFVKIMGDTLSSIGYYRYVTIASHLDSSEFNWSISLTSEYATDPLVLEQGLNQSGCKIIDIVRNSSNEWTYSIDMSQGFLNIARLEDAQELKLRRSLYAHWLDVSDISQLEIKSSRSNQWYPYIAYYNASLNLLKIIKEKKIHNNVLLQIPENAKYVKISDVYTLKNVKDELLLLPKGSK